MSTARQIVEDALQLCGAVGLGQTASGNIAKFGLQRLNDLSAQWAMDSLWPIRSQSVSGTLAPSVGAYTIGAGATINTVRPESITAAAIVDGSSYQPMEQIAPDEWANRNRSDDASGVPAYFRYLPSYPFGYVEIYPLPDRAYTIELMTQQQGQQYDFADNIGLTPAYESAFRYGLAAMLGESLGKDVSALRMESERMIARIKRNNAQARTLVNEWSDNEAEEYN